MKSMTFYSVEVTAQGPDWIDLDIACSKGSYIRSWVKLLGEKLGCGATLAALNRTKSEPYLLNNALTLEGLQSTLENGQEIGVAFISFEGLQRVALGAAHRGRFRGTVRLQRDGK